MGRALLLALAPLALCVPAEPASAQGRDCRLLPEPEPEFARRLVGAAGNEMLFVSGPFRIACRGGIIVSADSAMSTGTGELRLFRDVFYEDSAKTLTAGFATYYRALGRLIAREDVVVRDRFSPSIVRGAELQYDRASAGEPLRLVVRGRPRAYLYEEGTPPLRAGLEASPMTRVIDGDTLPAGLQVDADRLELIGESRMLAHGRVQMIRENVRAFGDVADYQRDVGRLDLTGGARVLGEGFELLGDRIQADLTGEELDRVVAQGSARLEGEEIEVLGETIRVYLDEQQVERLVTVAPRAPDGTFERGQGVLPARAFAEDFTLRGDSIEAVAPGQELDSIVAVGDAYAERRVDSLAVDVSELVDRDWLRGDTIVGLFARLEPQDADSARTVLDRLIAVSASAERPARSLYRMEAGSDDADRPAVNYMIARRIDIRFLEGEVDEVRTEGPIQGLHLEPQQAARQEPQPEQPVRAPATEPSR